MQAFELSADNKPDHRTVSHLASIHFKWTFAQSSDSEFTHDFFFRDGALTCIWGWHIFIHRQQFPKVFLSPCSDFQLRVQRSQTWFWTLSPVHRDFSRFSLLMIFHVDDVMLKVFTILQCGTLFWNCSIIWWWIFLQTSAHLCFWETLEKNYFYTQSYYRPAANCKSFFKMQVTYSSMWKVQLCSNERKKILMHTSEQWFLRLIALNWFVFCSPEILYFERVCEVFESQCCSQTMFSLQMNAGGNVLNRVRKHVKMTEKLS